MTYTYKEYSHVFDTPAKKQQEKLIVQKIMGLINNKKYNDINDFINKNGTYQDFLDSNDFTNVVKHFGNTLNEADYTKILEQIKLLTQQKKSFDEENLKTTNIEGKQYNTYQGDDKTFFLDNTHSDKSIERQMEDLQGTEEKFQTSDAKQNTENMMNELESRKKESLNLMYLNNINIENLNEKQKQIFMACINYQIDSQRVIRVDINREVIVDDTNTILKIRVEGDNITIVNEDNSIEKSNNNEEKGATKSLQKSLVPSPNTIYSENN